MNCELHLHFPDQRHVVVSFDDTTTGTLLFANPLTPKDRRDMQWYLEVYGAQSLGDPDDGEARRITELLPVWGNRLFEAVFADQSAFRLLDRFLGREDEARLLTISAEHPSILALPWELLHDPHGEYLFRENPRISIRRRVAGATGGRPAFKVQAKERLHLLFVVSRPKGSGFIDPRADAQAVLDALEKEAPGRFTWEFLRPPTLDALVERLEDKGKPPVDILHFDGHGVFDRDGGLPEAVAAAKQAGTPTGYEVYKEKAAPAAVASPPNTGYLLFETDDGLLDFVSARQLGENLHRHRVALVILSACQTAALGDNDEPMGSVAARLTATGIPAVLAMTHSVLVHTTRALFGAFYRELARGHGIGESLDNARRFLANHPEKYEVQRGPRRMVLTLYDWFLPALYQGGEDQPLLTPAAAEPRVLPPRTNLPPRPEAGFFGRRRELWDIERWLAGPTRRITLTGFGGQGKTALALEAGRWLTRIGLFRAVVLVDYSRVQSRDAAAVAVNEIGSVLGESLIDAGAARDALDDTPTLVILDNLEALAPEALHELLDAAAGWSLAGGSRVLCTTRKPDFDHPDYRVEGALLHRRIPLAGLGSRAAPDDALEWYAELMKLPPPPAVEKMPTRQALIELFHRVSFHPLSIRVLAQQLKTRRPEELGDRLGQLLAAGEKDGSAAAMVSEDTPAGLLASLQLSLDRLDDAARQVLPRLGVFQGGAFEDDLLAITGLGDDTGQREQLEAALAAIERGDPGEFIQAAGIDLPEGAAIPDEILAKFQEEEGRRSLADAVREQLAALPTPTGEPDLWPSLRRQLEAAALLEAESIPGVSVPYLRFHPTLAPLLWAQLDADSRARLGAAHRTRYYELSQYLYGADDRTPHEARAIALRELPNLLHAAHAALEAGDPKAVDFADNVNHFLYYFGLKKEAELLVAGAQAAAGEAGTAAWFLAQSARGEQLRAIGRVADAAEIFQAVLGKLGDEPGYERAITLARLGRCFRASGRPDLAARHARDAIAVLEQLEQTESVKRHRGVCLTDLADALRLQGRYNEARKAYEDGLLVAEEFGDLRQQGVTLGQLGTLAMLEGNLDEAAARYRDALALFQRLREPAMEAVAWHQLGMVFQEARQWEEAERHYREAARIREQQGNLAGAAQSWNNLATVSQYAGKPEAAEQWYRKAIEGGRKTGNMLPAAQALNNLANLLQELPGRLTEARQLAEEALVIMQTLDPGAAEIWKIYNILAEIAEREADNATDPRPRAERRTEAREYRRLAREAKRSFAGTRHQLKQHAPLIMGIVLAVTQPDHRKELEEALYISEQRGGTNLVAAIRRLLAGERDADMLCESLDSEDSMIVETILRALDDPSTLADLLPEEAREHAAE